jgi:hypothetical protein
MGSCTFLVVRMTSGVEQHVQVTCDHHVEQGDHTVADDLRT